MCALTSILMRLSTRLHIVMFELEGGGTHLTAIACRWGCSRQVIEHLISKVLHKRAHVQRELLYICYEPAWQSAQLAKYIAWV